MAVSMLTAPWLRRCLLLGSFAFCTPLQASSSIPEHACSLRLTGFDNPSVLNIFAEAVLREAYQRAGCTYTIHKLPLKRGDVEANSGKYDGLIGRSSVGESAMPNLMRVPTPIGQFDLVPYVRNETLAPLLISWEKIKHAGLKVGVRSDLR
jgi:hypothetical protein